MTEPTGSPWTKVEDKLHTVAEVATIFSVEPATVRLWIRQNKIAAMKVGKGWRVSRQAMANFANREKV
jgi:excisionase family DNA binding protein